MARFPSLSRGDWGRDKAPRTPWHRTCVYELHVKGFTRLLRAIPEAIRGTYAGLASGEAIEYLNKLGVSAMELLPVHHHLDDSHLLEKNLTNYWGYNTLSFFAFEPGYAAARSMQADGVVLISVFELFACAPHRPRSQLSPWSSSRGWRQSCRKRH